ncbi:unnamed protein product [Vitrella brassicaformis CCMP3155]|uniref:3-beta hydroxysteroid dehydrogenase/isomerase domain-containing protein n=1 Tax=Vitrella brassicaformis (strain CCMP3155) TaxID=1169540 RepID=A0A0G4EM83_VITBC|nr:unnamed protein product [Vitrella brassicaformis CCMP3155]|eukprot:CEL98090.1 unnamed protein product [Vitrella brassicaformis CCMP3155]
MLREWGYRVAVMDLAPNCYEAHTDVSYVHGDLTSAADLDRAMGGIDVVLHVASPNPQKLDRALFQKVNVDGTQAIIAACVRNGVPCLVYTSSASVVFGTTGLEGADESIPYPAYQPDDYSHSKMRAEKMVLDAHSVGGLHTVALRPHGIFGIDDPGCMGGFLEAGRKGKLKTILGNGDNVVDFTCVENVAHGHVLAADALLKDGGASRVGGKAYNLTNAEPIRFWSFAAKICGEMGFDVPRYKIPYWLALVAANVSEALIGEDAHLTVKKVRLAGLPHWYRCDAAQRDFGYAPILSLEDGLKKACAAAREAQAQKGETAKVPPRAPPPSWLRFGGFGVSLLGQVVRLVAAVSLVCRLGGIPLSITLPFGLGAVLAWSSWSLAGVILGTSLAVMAISIVTGADPIPEISPYPIIGVIPDFAKSPLAVLKRASREYRDVFRLNLGGMRITFFTGTDGLDVFFKSRDTQLSQKEVYKLTVPVFGKGVVYDADLDVRLEQFHMLTTGLSERHMKRYVGYMVKECEMYFSRWGDSGEVDIGEAFAELIILTASRCLMGREVREQMFEEVAKLYHALEEGITHIGFIAPWLPIPKHLKRDKARRQLVDLYSRVLRARRAAMAEKDASLSTETQSTTQSQEDKTDDEDLEHDVIEVLLKSRYRDGRALTDDELCGMLIVLLFAGQHTSSVTSLWLSVNLLSNASRVMPSLVKEQESAGPVDFDMISKSLPKLTAAIIESLRMYPPLFFLFRYVKEPLVFKGRVIPTNSTVAMSPAETGRNPDIFDQPDFYQPARWLTNDWDEWRKVSKYVSFGSGGHTCMGRRFALLQIRTIFSLLMRNFVLEQASPVPAVDETAMVAGPKTPFRVKYRKIHTGTAALMGIDGQCGDLMDAWGFDEKSQKVADAMRAF